MSDAKSFIIISNTGGCDGKARTWVLQKGTSFCTPSLWKDPCFFCTLTCLKGPHTGVAERPKFFTLKTEGPHMGVAERYKFFLNLNILKGPHMGGSKRPKFLSPLFNLKARTWVLQKGTSSF